MKVRPMGAELFHEDERTDRQRDGRTDRCDEANSRFRNFVKALKTEGTVNKKMI